MHGKYKGTDLAKIIFESANIAESQDVTHRLFVLSGVVETANNQVGLNIVEEKLNPKLLLETQSF